MIKKRMLNKTFCLLGVFLVVLIFSSGVSLGAITELSGESLNAKNALELAQKSQAEMQKAGFSIIRYQDTFTLANQSYETQLALEKNKGKPDYSAFYDRIKELEKMKQQAFSAMDELKALELTINQMQDIDRVQVLEIYQAAQKELISERYENCLKKIEEAYTKISELEATRTKIKAFYEATSRGLVSFLKAQWKWVLTSLLAFVLVILLSYGPITRHRLKKKIKRLEQRKEVIKKLIAQTQKEYLERGAISGAKYEIRTKKYSELIRDINRQIPLLKTELEMKKKRKD